jgi:hypothetical protein
VATGAAAGGQWDGGRLSHVSMTGPSGQVRTQPGWLGHLPHRCPCLGLLSGPWLIQSLRQSCYFTGNPAISTIYWLSSLCFPGHQELWSLEPSWTAFYISPLSRHKVSFQAVKKKIAVVKELKSKRLKLALGPSADRRWNGCTEEIGLCFSLCVSKVFLSHLGNHWLHSSPVSIFQTKSTT